MFPGLEGWVGYWWVHCAELGGSLWFGKIGVVEWGHRGLKLCLEDSEIIGNKKDWGFR